jgi:signal transduction histidine kinase
MQQLLIGFVVGLLVLAPALILFLRKKGFEIRRSRNKHLKEFENLSKLTGELAHEIKNPLSTIKINLKLVDEALKELDSDRPDEKRSDRRDHRLTRALRKIAVIDKETDRLEHILDSFLRYADRTELQLAEVDINELISDMVDFYSPQSRSHSIILRLGLYDVPLVCKADAGMLKQAVLNLLINAQQAMTDGGELMIRTNRQKKDAVITISDTGRGISPAELPKIFDAYYSSRPSGSGLGLPTTKKIIEAHNGAISVNSEQGKGTLFSIKLPLLGAG